MKKLINAVDRFCIRHPRFGIPNLMLYVVIGNAIVWLFMMMDTTGTLYGYLCLIPSQVCRGQLWRLITFALIPNNRGIWALLFLYFYYFIGNTLERQWGAGRFTLFFFSGLVCTIVYSLAAYFITGSDVYMLDSYGTVQFVDATYIYLSMFFSFATLYPDQRVLLFFFIPLKIKWLALVDAAFFVFEIIVTASAGYYAFALLPVVAILNYLLFCGEEIFHFSRGQVHTRQRAAEFRRKVDNIHAQERVRSYRFKCAVCGRTDTEHPELEFRYCSRCEGYHCFCQDHINSHIHFTE